jgi:REP element-mobilizing transposase RayT
MLLLLLLVLRIHAYCLMPNHIHLMATPERLRELKK